MDKGEYFMLTVLLLILCFIIMLVTSGSGSFYMANNYFEPLGLLLQLVIIVPMVFINHYHKDFLRALKIMWGATEYSLHEMKMALESVEFIKKAIIYTTIMLATFYFILILRTCDDLSAIGPKINMILLFVFYMSIFELLLLPLHAKLKKRIYKYMEDQSF